jgi:haloacetate dehalogenase
MIIANSDLFPGFADRIVMTGGAQIHARVGGRGPALLLLHGYPQTHICWHRVAPTLAASFTVVAADLRGYGNSSCPPTDMDHRPYSKTVMAMDMLDVMTELGITQFHVMGHDRGACVAYRMALEYPERITRLILIDTIPTLAYWQRASSHIAMRPQHRAFLAQPSPLPEALIGANPADWVERRLRRGTGSRSLDTIDPRALAAYKSAMSDPDRIHASCEDHRASALVDVLDDEQARIDGRMIECPTLVLWADDGPLSDLPDVLGLWEPWCQGLLKGCCLHSGHHIPEEQPQALLESVLPFLRCKHGRCE